MNTSRSKRFFTTYKNDDLVDIHVQIYTKITLLLWKFIEMVLETWNLQISFHRKIHILLSIWHFSKSTEVIALCAMHSHGMAHNCLSCILNSYTQNTHTHWFIASVVYAMRILGHALIENKYYEYRLFIAMQRSKSMLLISMIRHLSFCWFFTLFVY